MLRHGLSILLAALSPWIHAAESPQDADPAATVITLMRSSCFGTCPQYSVEIRGNGDVTYRGEYSVLVTGTHHWHVDPASVAGLLELFKRADYFNLADRYEIDASDLPTFTTGLTVGERKKSVVDYGGSGMGGAIASTANGNTDPHMPPLVTEIENAIDRVAATRSWVSGDEHTMERLRAIKWRFRTRQAGAALQQLLFHCNTTLVREFVLAGAPVDVTAGGWYQRTAIDEAARCDDVDLVRLLIARGGLQRPRQARSFLESSVAAGYPQMVAIALQHYADAKIKDREGVPLISRAAASEPPDETSPDFDPARVVEMLLRAGANPNARDEDSNTSLFEASRAAVARVLIAGKADPNARNREGQTPLFEPYFDDVKSVLIESGAQVDARDNTGSTPLFHQQYPEDIEVLIHAGADVNAKDTNGNTAVEQVPAEKAVLTLLDAGAQLPSDPTRMQALVEKARKHHWDKALARLEPAGR